PSALTPPPYATPASSPPPPLSLHDALPLYTPVPGYTPCTCPPPLVTAEPVPRNDSVLPTTATPRPIPAPQQRLQRLYCRNPWLTDRKSTRLNSSHVKISYAVFCLKKKKKKT